jgi:hypothetical protein
VVKNIGFAWQSSPEYPTSKINNKEKKATTHPIEAEKQLLDFLLTKSFIASSPYFLTNRANKA